MGYFAVLSKSAEEKMVVTKCHLNLWSLPGLWPGRKLLYLDVGLELKAESASITGFQILLPFRAEKAKWAGGTNDAVLDLYDPLCTDDIAELVFGGPVVQQVEQNGRSLEIGDYSEPLHLRRIDAGAVEAVESFQERPDSSLYSVPLGEPINRGEKVYVRMRWRVLQTGYIWQRRIISGGASLDFRVCDVRESRFVSRERSLRSLISDIESVNFFLMASPSLQPLTHSPAYKYLRPLEPGAWSKYLDGAHFLGFPHRLLVYYWKYSSSSGSSAASSSKRSPISADNPFRVFTVLVKPSTSSWWREFFKMSLAILIAAAIIANASEVNEMWSSVQAALGGWWKWLIGVFGVATLLSFGLKLKAWASNRFLRTRKAIRAIERGLLSLTQRR